MNESLSQLSGWVWVIRFLPGQNIFLTDDAQVLEEDGPVELALAKGFARGELGEITPRPAVTIRKVGPGPTNKTERTSCRGMRIAGIQGSQEAGISTRRLSPTPHGMSTFAGCLD